MIECPNLLVRASVALSKRQRIYVSSEGIAAVVHCQLTGLPQNSVVGRTLEPIAKGAEGLVKIRIRYPDDLRRLKAMTTIDRISGLFG